MIQRKVLRNLGWDLYFSLFGSLIWGNLYDLRLGFTMAYEYIISFGTPGWLTTYSDEVLRKIESLPTFVDVAGNAICLLGFEDRDREDRWRFDIRLFLRNDEDLIFLEASAQPASIQRDLTEFINWLDSRTSMRLLDDDGEQIEGVFIRD